MDVCELDAKGNEVPLRCSERICCERSVIIYGISKIRGVQTCGEMEYVTEIGCKCGPREDTLIVPRIGDDPLDAGRGIKRGCCEGGANEIGR